MNDIIIKLASPILGKRVFQRIFEWLNQFSLLGMNIGGGGDFRYSGEKPALFYIRNHLKNLSDPILFDVGANVGNYSILLREVFGNKAKIYSFEPSHKTFHKLSLNVGGKNLYNFGFGSENKKVNLYSNPNKSGLASVYERNLEHVNLSLKDSEEVEIITLDSFCKEHDIKHIDFLKIDVEGHELEVLRGAEKLINSGMLDFIQFEFGGCNIDSRTYFKDFYYLLKDKYKIYRIVKDGVYPINKYREIYEAFNTTNYLAERR